MPFKHLTEVEQEEESLLHFRDKFFDGILDLCPCSSNIKIVIIHMQISPGMLSRFIFWQNVQHFLKVKKKTRTEWFFT